MEGAVAARNSSAAPRRRSSSSSSSSALPFSFASPFQWQSKQRKRRSETTTEVSLASSCWELLTPQSPSTVILRLRRRTSCSSATSADRREENNAKLAYRMRYVRARHLREEQEAVCTILGDARDKELAIQKATSGFQRSWKKKLGQLQKNYEAKLLRLEREKAELALELREATSSEEIKVERWVAALAQWVATAAMSKLPETTH